MICKSCPPTVAPSASTRRRFRAITPSGPGSAISAGSVWRAQASRHDCCCFSTPPSPSRGMSLDRLVALSATSPAKPFGLFPRKRTIAIGSCADLVLFDPNATTIVRVAEHHSQVDYRLFAGPPAARRRPQGILAWRIDSRWEGLVTSARPRPDHQAWSQRTASSRLAERHGSTGRTLHG